MKKQKSEASAGSDVYGEKKKHEGKLRFVI